MVPEQVDRRAAAAQRFHHKEHRDRALSFAARFLRQEHAEAAQLLQDIPEFLRMLMVLVTVLEIRLQVLTGHGLFNRLHHQFLLFGKLEIHNH